MHVRVNGVRLFFDVEGTGLVPDGPAMREKPTLLLLHGGPGAATIDLPARLLWLWPTSPRSFISIIAAMAEARTVRRKARNLAQWGDDVRAFCDVLGIANPIVLGASFGGMVALAYATRHPSRPPSRLVLISTEAAGGTHRDRRVALFERFGGPEVGALARRRFLEVRGHPDQASLEAWQRLAIPLYTRIPHDADMARRAVNRPEVLRWFAKPGGESQSFNMLSDLTASGVRPSSWAAKTIRSIRSKARRISQPRCPPVSCSSNGFRTAGMRWSPMRPSAPWR